MTQGNLNYSNEVGWISYMQYLVNPGVDNQMFVNIQLNNGYFEFKFCFNKKDLAVICEGLEEWLDTKLSVRADFFQAKGFYLKETNPPMIQSLTRVRVKHPKRGLQFSRNDIFQLSLENHNDVFLTQADLRNIIAIVKCV